MKTKVVLSQVYPFGCLVSLENDDCGSIDLCRSRKRNAKHTCAVAARILRELANRVDRLGSQAEPFSEATQMAVNRLKEVKQ